MGEEKEEGDKEEGRKKKSIFIAFFGGKKKCNCSTLLLRSHRHETFPFLKEASRKTEFPVLYTTSRSLFSPLFISVQHPTPPTSNDGMDLIQLQQNVFLSVFREESSFPTSEAAFINGKETQTTLATPPRQ